MFGTTIVVCAEIEDPNWRWLQSSLSDTGVTFEIVRCTRRNALERMAPFGLARLRGCFEAVQTARRSGAKALVAHGPTLAAWCALLSRALGLKIPIIAHSFNFTALPSGLKKPVFTLALSTVASFVVFSTVERELYAKAFALPAEKFDVVLWGVRPPRVDAPETPLEQGDYVCAVGGNARDYRTLIEAARQLPELKFVLVVRPHSLSGLVIPPNVVFYKNLAPGKAMNILLHSRFMVLPLVGSEVPCGHVTLVAAMHLSKAFTITASSGVRDYVQNGENALTVTPGSTDSLTAAIKRLWHDPALCTRLGENGRRFAARECTEERIAEHFRGWMRCRGLLTQQGRAPIQASRRQNS